MNDPFEVINQKVYYKQKRHTFSRTIPCEILKVKNSKFLIRYSGSDGRTNQRWVTKNKLVFEPLKIG